MVKHNINIVTLVGMSGVGKTSISQILPADKWCFVSVDLEILKLLEPKIKAYIHKQITNSLPKISQLISANVIDFHLTKNLSDLSALSYYLGMIGEGELTIEEFLVHQTEYRNAERLITSNIINNILSHSYEGYNNFIIDTTGSIVEIIDFSDDSDPLLAQLQNLTKVLYIESDTNFTNQLISRYIKTPKPLLFNPHFLQSQLDIYIKTNNLRNVNDINPISFMKDIISPLLNHRLPYYRKLAQKGITIPINTYSKIKTEAAFLELFQN